MTARNRDNKIVRSLPGGPALLEAIVDVGNMERALLWRTNEGDVLAGLKLQVAVTAMNRLEEIRAAMIEHANQEAHRG